MWCIWGQLLPLGATASLSPRCELSQREQVHARYTPSTSSNLPLILSVSPSFFHNDSHSGFSSVMQSHATSVYTLYVHACIFIAFQKLRSRGGSWKHLPHMSCVREFSLKLCQGFFISGLCKNMTFYVFGVINFRLKGLLNWPLLIVVLLSD